MAGRANQYAFWQQETWRVCLMLKNAKSRGAESSALQNEKAFVLAGQVNYTIPVPARQGFETSFPCHSCKHFCIVRFSRSRMRHLCGYSGSWLESCGVQSCPMQRAPFLQQTKVICAAAVTIHRVMVIFRPQKPFFVISRMERSRRLLLHFIVKNFGLSGHWGPHDSTDPR